MSRLILTAPLGQPVRQPVALQQIAKGAAGRKWRDLSTRRRLRDVYFVRDYTKQIDQSLAAVATQGLYERAAPASN